MKSSQYLTRSDVVNSDIRHQLERQIQNHEAKDNGRRFDKIISMTVYFFEITELNGSTCVKKPKRISAILGSENDKKNVSTGQY